MLYSPYGSRELVLRMVILYVEHKYLHQSYWHRATLDLSLCLHLILVRATRLFCRAVYGANITPPSGYISGLLKYLGLCPDFGLLVIGQSSLNIIFHGVSVSMFSCIKLLKNSSSSNFLHYLDFYALTGERWMLTFAISTAYTLSRLPMVTLPHFTFQKLPALWWEL